MTVGPVARAQDRARRAEGAATAGGQLPRRYRSLAGITQELAEPGRYSANCIGKLERDDRGPPGAALDRLVTTLGLGNQERVLTVMEDLVRLECLACDGAEGSGPGTGPCPPPGRAGG